ncbi:MAG: hypothetical protein ABEH78_10420 [Haloferacaceae archaeon]
MSDDSNGGIPGYPKPLVGILSSAVFAVLAAIPFGLEGWLVGALVGAAIGDQLIRRMVDDEDGDGDGDGEGNGEAKGVADTDGRDATDRFS